MGLIAKKKESAFSRFCNDKKISDREYQEIITDIQKHLKEELKPVIDANKNKTEVTDERALKVLKYFVDAMEDAFRVHIGVLIEEGKINLAGVKIDPVILRKIIENKVSQYDIYDLTSMIADKKFVITLIFGKVQVAFSSEILKDAIKLYAEAFLQKDKEFNDNYLNSDKLIVIKPYTDDMIEFNESLAKEDSWDTLIKATENKSKETSSRDDEIVLSSTVENTANVGVQKNKDNEVEYTGLTYEQKKYLDMAARILETTEFSKKSCGWTDKDVEYLLAYIECSIDGGDMELLKESITRIRYNMMEARFELQEKTYDNSQKKGIK